MEQGEGAAQCHPAHLQQPQLLAPALFMAPRHCGREGGFARRCSRYLHNTAFSQNAPLGKEIKEMRWGLGGSGRSPSSARMAQHRSGTPGPGRRQELSSFSPPALGESRRGAGSLGKHPTAWRCSEVGTGFKDAQALDGILLMGSTEGCRAPAARNSPKKGTSNSLAVGPPI